MMEMAVKTMKGAKRGAGRRRRPGEHLPYCRRHGGAPPLSPLPSWLLGRPPPWRWDPWGRQKTWLLAAVIRGRRSPPRVRFPPFI
jgi:hypothetical protein